MIAVIFEAEPKIEAREQYFSLAANLKPQLIEVEGFISIERFQSLAEPNRILSLSFWKDEQSVTKWRNQPSHRYAQQQGKMSIFENYRIRVADVLRDYGMTSQ